MTASIFEPLSLDREVVRWEDFLERLTPVERKGEIYFKRDDAFAPLGYGGPNGGKLRQYVYFLSRYAAGSNPRGLVAGASVRSPQIAASTMVARHYGLPVVQVIGATTPQSAVKHESVAIAARLGARFVFNRVAYNPALQRKVRDLQHDPLYEGYYALVAPVGANSPPEEILGVHTIAAEQVRNLPDVTDLVVPAGSCGSAASVLFGLALHQPDSIRDVHLIGIGPSKLIWLEHRLAALEGLSGVQLYRTFDRSYAPEETNASALYRLHYHDVYATGVRYEEEVPWEHDGINFHPTYEGKVMRFLAQEKPELLRDGRTCVWVVGSKASWAAIRETVADYDREPELVAA
jgi:1-aminocyclopropane-1-carboxylate deaminase/D-cysteine desulfhydrase-like pyridoxal-dependent ACC family enzyme